MKKHLKTLSLLNIIFGVMGLVGGIISIILILGVGLLAGHDSGEENVIYVAILIATIFVSVALISSVPFIIAGVGLKKGYNWARILTIVLGVINLVAFPFGTALGIYALWVCTNNEIVKEFIGNPVNPAPQSA